MKISIIIPVFNNWNFTKSCLKDVSKLNSKEHEIIIIDNGSTDTTKEISLYDGDNLSDHINKLIGSSFDNNIIVVRNQINLGFAKACNTGFAKCSGEVVIFLNNDIRVRENFDNWTEPLVEAAMDGYLAGPTGGLLDNDFKFICETSSIYPKNFYISGWCIAASHKTFKQLCMGEGEVFSTEFGTAFFEDTDLSFRAKILKIPFKITPISVVHFGHVTARQINLAALYTKAREIFVRKWKSRKLK